MAAAAVAEDGIAHGWEHLRVAECAAAEAPLGKMVVALRSPPGGKARLVVEVRSEAFLPDRIEHRVADIGLEAGVDTFVAVAGCEHHAERQAGDTVAPARPGFVRCHLQRRSAAGDRSIVAVADEAVERRGASLGVAADAVGRRSLGAVATEASRSLVDAAECRTGAADVASSFTCCDGLLPEKARDRRAEACRGTRVCLKGV